MHTPALVKGYVCALAALAGFCVAFIAHAQAPELVTSFANGAPSGRYAFASWTPKTLVELMQGGQSGEAVNIVGHLFLPPGNDKVPAVVLVHGSGGIYRAVLDYWPKQFNAAGIAVFTIDMFGPRGVQSTAEDQSQVPFAADMADAFAALRLLATHPRIDPRRIAIMGFSRGGPRRCARPSRGSSRRRSCPTACATRRSSRLMAAAATGVFAWW